VLLAMKNLTCVVILLILYFILLDTLVKTAKIPMAVAS